VPRGLLEKQVVEEREVILEQREIRVPLGKGVNPVSLDKGVKREPLVILDYKAQKALLVQRVLLECKVILVYRAMKGLKGCRV
jgi:hypothetical protein